jgi:hypothetical protein
MGWLQGIKRFVEQIPDNLGILFPIFKMLLLYPGGIQYEMG